MGNTKRQRVGLFGGTFNPLHMGHINSMVSLTKRAGLDCIYAIPANQNPLKDSYEGPSAQQRLDMVKVGLAEYRDMIVVDEQEITRGGKSYTVETVRAYSEKFLPEQIYLIVGLDEFYQFDLWKDYAEILQHANLLVTSRPGQKMPRELEQVPVGLRRMIAAFDEKYIELETGCHIQFIELEDIDVSASEIRKKIRTGKKVDRYLPLTVEEFIKQEGLYRPSGPLVADYDKLTRFCGEVLFRRKAIAVRGFDLRLLEAPCEFSLIASGTSTRHAQALAEHVVKAVKEEFGIAPIGSEGKRDGRWVLIDYGALIVHVFYDYVRNEYRLEDLWREGKDLLLKDSTPETGARGQ